MAQSVLLYWSCVVIITVVTLINYAYDQCDQMVKLFLRNLAIHNKEKLFMSVKIVKVGLKVCQRLKNRQKLTEDV